MPVHAGGNPEGGRGFGSVNGSQRREIVADIIGQISYASDVQRTRSSLKSSKNFHLDAIALGVGEFAGHYRVDIQFKGGGGGTVAQAIVPDTNGVSHWDIREALRKSLENGQKYVVT